MSFQSKVKSEVASDPAPLGRKEGLVLIACACAPANESLIIGLAALSVNFPSIL